MRKIIIEDGDGDVEVTVEPTQNKKEVVLGTTDGGNNFLKPLEAVELGKMLITAASECLGFPESHAITEDLRKFIEGGPVEP